MSKAPKQEKPNHKEYSVSKEDQELLEGQRSVRTHYLYLAELIERDMRMFVEIKLRKQFNIADDMNIMYDSQTKKVYAMSKQAPEQPQKEQNEKN